MTETNTAIFSISLVVISGILAGRVAENFNFPKTIPLILTGIMIAIFSNLNIGITGMSIDIAAIRDIAVLTAELALITVLFKEGMHLNLKALKKQIVIILLIAVFGTILTTVIVGLTVNLSLGLSLSVALLVGAIFTPTDPAATFSALRGGGETKVEDKFEVILGGESALNDVIAIILVVVILIPSSADPLAGINLTSEVFITAFWQFFGGALIGFIVGFLTLILFSVLPTKTEESMVSLASASLIFGLGFVLGVSSAIGALVAGIVLANPKLFGREDYSKAPMFQFWDNITFLFEISAFIFIGTIFSLGKINFAVISFAFVLSIIVLFGRFAGVYLITWLLEFSNSTKEYLNNKERFFIGFAGMRGLTTAILATLAYLEFGENSTLGQLILYSSILVLIFTGLFQGIFLKTVAKKMDVLEEVNKLEEMLAQKIVLLSSLEFLVSELEGKKISFDNFQRLALRYKEELFILEENLLLYQAEQQKNIQFLRTSLMTNDKSRDSLIRAFDSGEIKNDIAFEKMLQRLDNEKKEIQLLFSKLDAKPLGIESIATDVAKSIQEVEDTLANTNKFLSKELKTVRTFISSIPRAIKPVKKSNDSQNSSNEPRSDAG